MGVSFSVKANRAVTKKVNNVCVVCMGQGAVISACTLLAISTGSTIILYSSRLNKCSTHSHFSQRVESLSIFPFPAFFITFKGNAVLAGLRAVGADHHGTVETLSDLCNTCDDQRSKRGSARERERESESESARARERKRQTDRERRRERG